MAENGNGSPIERVSRPFGAAKKPESRIAIDWSVMAAGMGISEEELSTGKKGQIEEILANPNWSNSRKNREIEYVLGTRKRKAAKQAPKTEAEKKEARHKAYLARRAARQTAAGKLGLTVTTTPRETGLSPEERDDKRKAQNAARRRLTTRNKQVLTMLLPNFHEKYLGVDAAKRESLMSGGVRDDIKAARDAGVWDEMKIEIATDALTNVGFSRSEATKIAKRKMGG